MRLNGYPMDQDDFRREVQQFEPIDGRNFVSVLYYIDRMKIVRLSSRVEGIWGFPRRTLEPLHDPSRFTVPSTITTLMNSLAALLWLPHGLKRGKFLRYISQTAAWLCGRILARDERNLTREEDSHGPGRQTFLVMTMHHRTALFNMVAVAGKGPIMSTWFNKRCKRLNAQEHQQKWYIAIVCRFYDRGVLSISIELSTIQTTGRELVQPLKCATISPIAIPAFCDSDIQRPPNNVVKV